MGKCVAVSFETFLRRFCLSFIVVVYVVSLSSLLSSSLLATKHSARVINQHYLYQSSIIAFERFKERENINKQQQQMSASNPEQFLLKEKQQKEKEKRVQDLLKSYYHEQQQQQQEEEEQEQEQKQSSKKTREIKEQNEQTNDGMKSWTKEEEKAHAGATSTMSQLQSDDNNKKKNNNSSIQNKNLIEMLKTKTIGELQNEYVNVSREIKRLESHGTHSVYENYSKFINAADFIENARPEIEQLTKKESVKVEKATKEAAEAARKLNETLDAKRFESERAREVQNVLFNIQEALKAPATIRNVLFGSVSSSSESARVEKAVRIIAKTKPMLEKFSSSPSSGVSGEQQHKSGKLFLEAKNETMKISDAIASLLKKRVRSSYHATVSQTVGVGEGGKDDSNALENLVNKLSSHSCAECLKLLGVPRDEVHEEFLYAEKDKLEKILTDLESDIRKSSSIRSDSGGAAETSTTVDSLFKPKLGKVNELFLNEFQKCAASYLEVFPEDSRQPLVDFAKVVFRRYFELLKVIFIDGESATKEEGNMGNLSSVRHMCAALGNMAADLASAHKLLPECALGDRVTEIVEKSIRKRIEDAHLRRESILSEKISQIEQLLSSSGSNTAAASPTIVADAVEDFLSTHETTANIIIADIKAFSEERPLLLQSWRDEFGRFSRALFATSHHALCARLVGFGSCRANSSCIPYLSPSQGLPNSPYLQRNNKTNGGSSTASSLIASVLLFKIGNESYTLENGLAKIFPSHVVSEKGKRSAAYDERLLRAIAMACFRDCFREFLMLSTSKLDALLIQYENASITDLFVDALEKIKHDVKNIEASPTLVQMLNSSTSESLTNDAGVVLDENAFDIFECKNKFSTARIVRRCVESSLSNFQEYIFTNVPTFTKETLKHFEGQCDAIEQELNREFHENTETHETCFSSLKTLARKRDVDGAAHASSVEASKLLKDIQKI